MLLVFLLLFSIHLHAGIEPVVIRVPEAKAWIGQRLPLYVELRARGSFAGAASFSLPEIPRTVIIKIGNPVVSSQQIDGESWFVQMHEFVLFSQQSGTVEIPAFEVRFGSHDGFTGPVIEQQAQVPGTSIEIQRPPGSESISFLITTESLDLSENWQPEPQRQPGPVKAGAIFKRTIVQRAAQMTGMALTATPTDAPDGVRVYPGQPEVTDKTERGDFLGERRETITYQLQKPGSLSRVFARQLLQGRSNDHPRYTGVWPLANPSQVGVTSASQCTPLLYPAVLILGNIAREVGCQTPVS